MKSLIFDTETTGKANMKVGFDAEGQPGLVELAFELYDHDSGEIIETFSTLVNCGVDIPDEAHAVHGISSAMMKELGMPINEALDVFSSAFNRADRLVAHNIGFDKLIISVAYYMIGKEIDWATKDQYCTMQSSTNLLKLPGPHGYKWPKLMEAYKELVDKDGFEAHRANHDVEATRKLMLKLEEIKSNV